MTAPYGLMAELGSAEALLAAARQATESGLAGVEAYSPFPIEGLEDALALPPSRVPLATLAGGLAGGFGGYFLQWYTAVIDYPINAGGRPLHSWPEFIPITFETTVLGAAFAAVVAMILANGLPRLRHPVFNVPAFEHATRNRFFLCLRADGPRFDAGAARHFLERLQPIRILEVPQ
jgi:hypothetical protein